MWCFSHSCVFLQVSVVPSFWLLSSSPCVDMFTFSCWWIGRYFLTYFSYEWSYHEHFCTNLSIDTGFLFLGKIYRRGIVDHVVIVHSLTKLYHFTHPPKIYKKSSSCTSFPMFGVVSFLRCSHCSVDSDILL